MKKTFGNIYNSFSGTPSENEELGRSVPVFGKWSIIEVILKYIFIIGTINIGQLFFLCKGFMISLALTTKQVGDAFKKRLECCTSAENV